MTAFRHPLEPTADRASPLLDRVLEDLLARVARLEAQVSKMPDPNDGMTTREAADFLGYSTRNFYRLLKTDPELLACQYRAQKGGHLRFDRLKLTAYR